MELDNIRKAYKLALELPERSTNKRLSPDHIINADKSVNWNKETVQKINDEIKSINDKLRSERYEAINKVQQAVIEYIESKCGSKNLAQEIHTFCVENSDHAGDEEYFYLVETIADFTEQARLN